MTPACRRQAGRTARGPGAQRRGRCLLAGRKWAWFAGIALAMLSCLGNVAFLFAFPVWCTMVIAFNLISIYAITAHGAEVRRDYSPAGED